MKKIIIISLRIILIFFLIILNLNERLFSSKRTYCYQAYTNDLYCRWVPVDCGCYTIIEDEK